MLRTKEYEKIVLDIKLLRNRILNSNIKHELVHFLLFRSFETSIEYYCQDLNLDYTRNNLRSIFPFEKILNDDKNVRIIHEDFEGEDFLKMYGNQHGLYIYLFIFFELNSTEISKNITIDKGNPYQPLLLIILNNGHLWKHHGQMYVDQYNVADDSRFINFEMPELSLSFLEFLSNKLKGKTLKNLKNRDLREIYLRFKEAE